MLFMLALLVFVLTLCGLFFAKDSFINREMQVYQKQLQEPWLMRRPLMAYNGTRRLTLKRKFIHRGDPKKV
ncbi:OrNVorf76-like [Venturia canescens]|uniref:OrNVorf76-like n=2 Tax=Venturia canescens TaxID=32260 RepID=A0ACB9ZHJ7_9HYME|nr:uncharacterized LOC122408859 precursor [Venturia canescens]AJZ73142.1 hypothetical protein [Venturia canescens]KAI5630629.1 OrNVorf76-like [Venturia canescens]